MPRQPVIDPCEDLLSGLKTADGVFAVDWDQRIVFWGPSAQQILGQAPAEVLGRPCYEVLGGRDARNFRYCRRHCPTMLNARRGRPTAAYDILACAAKGSAQWINISILLPSVGLKRPPVVVHLLRDVTQRRQLEQAASRAMATLRQFVMFEAEEAPSAAFDPAPTPTPEITRRELEVLRLLGCGLSTGEIAQSLGVSYLTARNHITNLLNKLGAKNRLQAVLYASHRQLI